MTDYENYVEHIKAQYEKVAAYDTYEDYCKDNDEFSERDFIRYKIKHILSLKEYMDAIQAKKYLSKKIKKETTDALKEANRRSKNLEKLRDN
jgi:hypothetical protein